MAPDGAEPPGALIAALRALAGDAPQRADQPSGSRLVRLRPSARVLHAERLDALEQRAEARPAIAPLLRRLGENAGPAGAGPGDQPRCRPAGPKKGR